MTSVTSLAVSSAVAHYTHLSKNTLLTGAEVHVCRDTHDVTYVLREWTTGRVSCTYILYDKRTHRRYTNHTERG